MKLKAVYEIHGLSKVLTGTRKAEGIANPGDLYEIDESTAKRHINDGYGIDPNDDTSVAELSHGPQIIEGELDNDAPLSLKDIATPAPAPKEKKSAKKAAKAPVEGDDIDDLGLDDGSDAVE